MPNRTVNTMDNENSATEKMPPSTTKPAAKSNITPETFSTMKVEIKEEAQQIFASHQGNVSKTKTMTEICSTMKEEIKAEAKRIVPDRGNK